jgi:hypothetical protein
MCGIAGFEINGVDTPAASAALLDALAARGPDGNWLAVRGSFALVETGLAVIDLSDEVVYPMANESGDVHSSSTARSTTTTSSATSSRVAVTLPQATCGCWRCWLPGRTG